MKLHLAAALALVVIAAFAVGCERRTAFWLLMMPPVGTSGSPDVNAPMKGWMAVSHPFASFSACERMRKGTMDFANRRAKDLFTKKFKNFDESQFAKMKAEISRATCISSDDPRLVK